MARARGARSLAAAAFETTEKTAPASGYLILPTRSNGIALEQGLIDDDIVGTRDPGDADLDSPEITGDVSIPMDVEASGWWLKALMGDPTTTEDTGVYTHVFESGAWSLPSFSLEKQLPDVPSFEMFRGCRANNLRLSSQRGGRLNGTVGVIGQAATTPASSTAAGTPGTYDLTRFVQRHVTVQIDGSDVADMMQLDLTYSNNLDAVQSVTADGFIGGLDPMRAEVSGSMRVRFSSESLFTTAKAGTSVALSLVASISASQRLTLAMPRVFLSVPSRPIEGPDGVEANFSFQGARDTDNSAMLTATLINGTASY